MMQMKHIKNLISATFANVRTPEREHVINGEMAATTFAIKNPVRTEALLLVLMTKNKNFGKRSFIKTFS